MQAVFFIDSKNFDRDAADGSKADKHCGVPAEMFQPNVSSWIEQAHWFIERVIDAGDVIELVAVAVRAGVSEVFWRIRSFVFDRNDVIADEVQLSINSG